MNWIKFDPDDESTWPREGHDVVLWYNDQIDYNGVNPVWDTGFMSSGVSGPYFCTDDCIIRLPAVYCWAEVDEPDWLQELEREEGRKHEWL